MKYWLPIWLTTALLGLYGFGNSNEDSSNLRIVTHDSGAKLIGGITPPDDEPGPDQP